MSNDKVLCDGQSRRFVSLVFRLTFELLVSQFEFEFTGNRLHFKFALNDENRNRNLLSFSYARCE